LRGSANDRAVGPATSRIAPGRIVISPDGPPRAPAGAVRYSRSLAASRLLSGRSRSHLFQLKERDGIAAFVLDPDAWSAELHMPEN
jgi:hypothetical protein